MHDPKTVAFEIRRPWYDKRTKEQRDEDRGKDRQGKFVFRYRPSWVTIWHVDPERDGTDNSCGWHSPKLTDKQFGRLKSAAWSEARERYFLRSNTKEWHGSRVLAEALQKALILYVARILRLKISYEYAARSAAENIHHPDCVDPAGKFCFLAGYHTNFKEDTERDREHHFAGIMANVASMILRDHRPWYKHPKWHFWHWSIQIHGVQNFKRWAFTRCATCGKRFGWNESGITNTWHGTGPLWFRSQRDVHHDRCHGSRVRDSSENPSRSSGKIVVDSPTGGSAPGTPKP